MVKKLLIEPSNLKEDLEKLINSDAVIQRLKRNKREIVEEELI